jgi:hypothetical protein
VADNVKRTECVKVCFTEREFIDLGRMAARDDRKVADWVWVQVRRSIYGMLAAEAQREQGTDADQ